jgi:hypothetical protein
LEQAGLEQAAQLDLELAELELALLQDELGQAD